MNFSSILALFGAVFAAQTAAELARIRMTQHGLDYVGGVVKGILQTHPDLQPGRLEEKQSGKTTVTLDLNHFTAPNLRVVSVAPNTLRFTSNGGAISATARGKWRQNRVLKGSISGTVSADSLNLNLEAAMTKTAEGKLQLTPGACSVSLGGLKVRLGGVIGKLLGPATDLAASIFKGSIYRKACRAMTSIIVDKGNPWLAANDISVDVRDDLKIDLQLAKNPEMTAAYFDVSFDGGIKEGSGPTLPIPAPAIAASSSSTNQVYFWLSSAAINGALDFGHKKGLLRYEVGRKDLKEKHHEKLQTSCDGGMLPPRCIGSILPSVAEMYPNTYAYAVVNSAEAPSITLENGKATIQMKAELAINVENPENAPIFKSHVDFKGGFAVNVVNEAGQYKLVGSLLPQTGSIAIDILESHIGGIVDTVIKSLVAFGEPIMLDYFNETLKKGYALPNISNIELQTPNLAFEKNALRVETSVLYKP